MTTRATRSRHTRNRPQNPQSMNNSTARADCFARIVFDLPLRPPRAPGSASAPISAVAARRRGRSLRGTVLDANAVSGKSRRHARLLHAGAPAAGVADLFAAAAGRLRAWGVV